MGFAISEMSFSPPLSVPVTYEDWMQATQSLDGCIAARNIEWAYSLVSVQGDRSLCVYQVPYADALREAYREAGMAFRRIWRNEGTPAIPKADPNDRVVVVEINNDSSQNDSSSSSELFNSLMPSVVLTDGNRTFLLTGITLAAVKSYYENTSLPFPCIWQATLIRPMT